MRSRIRGRIGLRGPGIRSTDVWSVARRPRWIALLVLALAVSAGFAALGQWQLARSIASGVVVERDTETVRPLSEVTEPQAPTLEGQVGQLVEVSGDLVPGDYSVLSERLNGGEEGYWVIGRLQTDDAALAVALGWAADRERAESVAAELGAGGVAAGGSVSSDVTLAGRYVAPEAPQLTDFEAGERSVMAPSALVNEWTDFEGRSYSGYLVSGAEVPGLDLIDAPEPEQEVSLNWLNLFYAAEWAVFSIFAVFLWYRLVKDAWEREVDEREEAERESSAGRSESARHPTVN